jgi:hypothetical protein
MRNVSLLDIFQDATRFSQQITGYAWERAEENSRLYQQNRQLVLQEGVKDLLYNIENGRISNDDDDYTGEYRALIDKWWDESLKDARANRADNAFTQRGLQLLKDQTNSRILPELRNAAEVKQSNFRNNLLAENIDRNNLDENQSAADKIAFAVNGLNDAFVTGDLPKYFEALEQYFSGIGAEGARAVVTGGLGAGKPVQAILGDLESYLKTLPDTITVKNAAGGGPEESTRPQAPEGAEDINVQEKVDAEIAGLKATGGNDLHTLFQEIEGWKGRAGEKNVRGFLRSREALLKKLEDEKRAGLAAQYSQEKEARGKKRADYETDMAAWNARRPTQGFTDEDFDTSAWKDSIRQNAAELLRKNYKTPASGGGVNLKAAAASWVEGLGQQSVNDLIEGKIIDKATGLPHSVNTFFQNEAYVDALWKDIEALSEDNKTAEETLAYFMDQGGGDEDKAKAAFKMHYFTSMFDYQMKLLKNAADSGHYPQAKLGVLNTIVDYLRSSTDLKNDRNNARAKLLAPFIQDLFLETRFGGMSKERLEAEVNRTVALLQAEKFAGFSPQADNEASMIKAISKFEENPGTAATLGEGNHYVEHLTGEYETQSAQLGVAMQTYFEERLGIATQDTGKYRSEEGKVNEVLGVKIFESLEGGEQVTMRTENGRLEYGINSGKGWKWFDTVQGARDALETGPDLVGYAKLRREEQNTVTNLRANFITDWKRAPPEWSKYAADDWNTAPVYILNEIDRMAGEAGPPNNSRGSAIWPVSQWEDATHDQRKIWLLRYYGANK